jgi:hypothetical protein
MTKFQVLGATGLAVLMLSPIATAQRGGGAVRGGARGAVVGGLVGGESGAATGAKIGAVTGAVGSVASEAQARSQYQATAAYQTAPHSNFNEAPPQVLATTPPAAAPSAAAPAPSPGGDAVFRKNGKPLVAVTFPSDWKQTIGDRYISAVSADGQVYAIIGPLEGAADKPDGIKKLKQGLGQYLQDIKYDDLTETKRGGVVLTGASKAKKSGVDVVFAAGVLDAGERQIVAAAFVVDSRIEDYYKETIRHICQTIRVGDEAAKRPVQAKEAPKP